ncbi:unnamed protein product [Rotaria socialis]|uniref:Transposase Tc1-like domain-containing protein n=1 Tax=Rotaria socialis TaxID=392032 RepID=A0A821YR74_9BILA|nr:unnamed protein product [Rotaria socialis]CAF4570260.1 unnamed protein product [Rotaria socialis]CAF4894726.1 unnamed protein product [Rotaria socialis]CAF4967987.1 unnamed protein product [Rotaria socialis]
MGRAKIPLNKKIEIKTSLEFGITQRRKKVSTPIDDRNLLRLCKKCRTKSSQILSSELILSNGKYLSARTVRRRLLDMGYKSYQAKKKTLRTLAYKKQRFLFPREHQY